MVTKAKAPAKAAAKVIGDPKKAKNAASTAVKSPKATQGR